MKRVFLFLATNLAIIVVLSISLRVLGVERVLDAQGVHLDLGNLLVFAFVFGMGGSFISLAISKWTAKRLTGAHVLEHPTNAAEQWLVETVRHQAKAAGIGMPEVAVFESPDLNAFATGARRDNALVAVSTGLLRKMDRGEIEAVLGHEVSHVANGDMVTLAYAAVRGRKGDVVGLSLAGNRAQRFGSRPGCHSPTQFVDRFSRCVQKRQEYQVAARVS